MRACQPITDGYTETGGVKVFYEVFGEGEPTFLLMPTWCVVHSRIWKMQIPYLARHHRVVTFDGPGNGRSDRPADSDAYSAPAHVDHALAVLDATGTERAIPVASSGGTHRTMLLAARHPERVEGVVFVGPRTPFGESRAEEVTTALVSGDHERFLEVFMTAAFNEPHSTKAIEDGIGWGQGTTLPLLVTALMADRIEELTPEVCASVTCPVLVVQGSDDRLTPESHGRSLVEAIGDNARFILVEGGGHRTDVRDPVRFSLLLGEFARSIQTVAPPPVRRWARASARSRRALFLSSPIGLGHAQRDVAIARELRAVRPDLEIEWLAQDPVSRVLEVEGEAVHPASRWLASESAHMESESAEHDLHCFQAWRRMDEILTANFMVLNDVLEERRHDIVIGDEAWEADHYLHENPELKRAGFVWLTDFVGWLPMPDGGEREAALATDYNAEMLEHVARFPRVRDRAIFVGDADDIVPERFGPDLPLIREWTETHYDFAGYITGFDPAALGPPEALRAELGYAPDERVCIVTVGGSAVGGALLRKAVDAFPLARRAIPELRMVVVTGPRLDPAALPERRPEGLEVRTFVPHLYRHLAACDVAVVQGGLTTTMELTASRRPFLYFPLAHHFEQNFHVPHRLDRYRAGRRMDFAATDADEIAAELVGALDEPVDYRPVEADGARRAAALIAELV